MQTHTAGDTEEVSLTEIWLRKDPKRWMAGAMAGVFAGLVMMAAAMLVSATFGPELWFPVKVAALPFLGGGATELGFHLGAIGTGLAFHLSGSRP